MADQPTGNEEHGAMIEIVKQRQYWDELSATHPDAAVIDPSDRAGHKNAYIIGLRNRRLVAALGAPGEGVVLDFGCGAGAISEHLQHHGYQTVGCDISMTLLRRARTRLGDRHMDVFCYDGHRIPLAADSVASIVTYVVLNHIIDDAHLDSLLLELARVLRPGGRLLAIEQIARRDTLNEAQHKRQRSLDEWLWRFAAAGLAVHARSTIRFGHTPTTYLVRLGIVPKAVHPLLWQAESFVGRVHPEPVMDYADVLFELRKGTD